MMNDLIKKLEALLISDLVPWNLVELKKVYDEIKTHPEIKIQKIENERLEIIEGRKPFSWPIYSIPSIDVSLAVLDKETVFGQFKKYILGYALDSTKKFDDDNMVKAFDCILYGNYKVGSVLTVKVRSVTPVKNGKFYEASINTSLLSCEVCKERTNSAKEIIRKAFSSNVIEMDKSLAVDLCKSGILNFNIDERFGIQVDKIISFTKTAMKEGVVYGIVYPVNEVDTDGDYASPEEVQKAAWRFMEDFQKFNYMHADDLSARDVALVESACALSDIPELKIKKGDWYIGIKVYNEDLKKQIESGTITGFSMEGSAQPGTPIMEMESKKQ